MLALCSMLHPTNYAKKYAGINGRRPSVCVSVCGCNRLGGILWKWEWEWKAETISIKYLLEAFTLYAQVVFNTKYF